ncbi:MAG: homoserine O-succinyltransferase [Oscillospiraceae bacterium]|jgi:homoserine O-succinyltransferase|nr:homoserine O-succinyltransferase [Oscillospiraceae bacterium]
MPIRIPDSLPARTTLEKENIFVMTQYRALHQDIRPLKLLILNLMPTKIVTETQLLRKLSNTPLQVEIELLRTVSHDARNIDSDHLESFYVSLVDIRDRFYDGMIITGAPVENLDFTDVDYWPELCEIMAWSKTHVHSTFHICWGAQAGLYYHYGIQKYALPKKLSGIYSHRILKPNSPFFRGFDDCFNAPHSRYTAVRQDDIEKLPDLELLAVSDEAGVFAVKNHRSRQFFVFGHPEYDRDTLALEYRRDAGEGLKPDVPAHYFPDDDPTRAPVVTWRAAAQLMYTNWLNYYVYQTTPYAINTINPEMAGEEPDDASERGGL